MTDQQIMPQRRRQGIAARLSQDLGYAQPRHISIRGGRFSLVDDTGTIIPCNLVDQTVGYYIDLVVADANEHKSKVYYGDTPYTEGDNSPPLCFSDNGVAPSTNALEPQSVTCATCQFNEIGSKISNFSGASIKACSDRKKIAAFIWGYPGDLLYQFVVPPASLGNMRGYLAHLAAHRLDPSDVVTRVYFEPQKTGVLNFYNVYEIDDRMDALLEYAFENNLGLTICGRDDQPRQGALPAPTQRQQLAPPQQPASAVHAPPPQQFATNPAVQQHAYSALPPQAPQFLPPQQAPQAAAGMGFQPIQQHGVNVANQQPAQDAPPPPRGAGKGRGGPRAGSGAPRGPRAAPQAQQPAPQAAPQQQAYPTPEQSQAPIPAFLQRAPQPNGPAAGFHAPAPQQAPQAAQGNGFGAPTGQLGAGAPMPQPQNGMPGGMVAAPGAPDAKTLEALQNAFNVPTR